MSKYTYTGYVTMFGREICRSWHGETFAPTKAKAVSNLKYQFRKAYGIAMNMPIDLNEREIKTANEPNTIRTRP